MRETITSQVSLSTAGSLVKRLGPNGLSTGTRLVVTNLHTDVSKEDLQELFGSHGPLKRVEMDKEQQPGMATVVFQHRTDALKAQAEFNQVKLDGMF